MIQKMQSRLAIAWGTISRWRSCCLWMSCGARFIRRRGRRGQGVGGGKRGVGLGCMGSGMCIPGVRGRGVWGLRGDIHTYFFCVCDCYGWERFGVVRKFGAGAYVRNALFCLSWRRWMFVRVIYHLQCLNFIFQNYGYPLSMFVSPSLSVFKNDPRPADVLLFFSFFQNRPRVFHVCVDVFSQMGIYILLSCEQLTSFSPTTFNISTLYPKATKRSLMFVCPSLSVCSKHYYPIIWTSSVFSVTKTNQGWSHVCATFSGSKGINIAAGFLS